MDNIVGDYMVTFDNIEVAIIIKCIETVKDYSEKPEWIDEHLETILDKFKQMSTTEPEQKHFH